MSEPIILQLTKIPVEKKKASKKAEDANGSLAAKTNKPSKDYLVQIVNSPRRLSGPEIFGLIDDEEVFKPGVEPGPTLAQLKAAIDAGAAGSVEMDRLGEFLYNKIFIGKIKGKLEDIMIQVKQKPYRLCIRVDESAPLLETIPWEYMKRQEGFVAFSLASVTRVLEDRDAHSFDPVKDLTMLLVYANPQNYGGEKRYQETEKASIAFIENFIEKLRTNYKVRVTKLIGADATRENFLTALADNHFDIVHFIGHGEVQREIGHIVMQDGDRIPGHEIFSYLSDPPPRLFYFNSCSTAKANNRDPFSSVAQALIRPVESNAVPAVIAMQYEINVYDSFVMAKEFYERLLDPESSAYGNLEAAMDKARRKLKIKNSSWGIPVLFLQTHERVMLFGERAPEPPPSQLKLHLRSVIPPPEPKLVNRSAEMMTVRDLIDSDKRLMMVLGLAGSGRGTIVRAALDPYLQDESDEIIIWLDLEGIKEQSATLDALYLALDHLFSAGLKPLWDDGARSLEEKLQALEQKIPNSAIIVLENIDTLLDEERRFRDMQVEQFFRHFGDTERRIFIIATSQFAPVPLGDAGSWHRAWRIMPVAGLTQEDAVTLLKQEGLTEDDEQLARLAVALDGHPQALKIVATAIKQEQLDLEQFLQAPDAPNKDLTSFFTDALLRSLSDAERVHLKRWSVFRNPVLREALLQVAQRESEAQAVVGSLQAKGILRAQNDYYYMPLLLRNVAYNELKQDPELYYNAHFQAASYFFYKTTLAFESLQKTANAATEDEIINNQLEARYHHLQQIDPFLKNLAQQYAESIFQLLMNRGRYRELEALIEESSGVAIDTFNVELFKARLKAVTGKSEEALDKLRFLNLRLEQGSFEQAIVINEIGVVLKERSYPQDADEMLEKFETAYELFGNVVKTSNNLDHVAEAHQHQATTTYNHGLVYEYFRRGSTIEEFNAAYFKSRELYQAALGIFETLEERDEEGIALVFNQLGEIYADTRFKERDPVRAERLWRDALEITERIDNPRLEISVAYQLARFLCRSDRVVEARSLFRRVADQALRINLLDKQAIAEVQIAEIDFKNNQYDRDNLDRALTRYEERLGYYDDAHSIRVQSGAYYLHGLLHRALKNRATAKELFERSREAIFFLAERSEGYGDAKRIARATVYLAENALLREGQDAARAMLLAQQQYFQRLDYQLDEQQSVVEFIDDVIHYFER